MEKKAVIDSEVTPAIKERCEHSSASCIEQLDNDLTKEAAVKITERLTGEAYEEYLK